jgi:hypothetical protein
MTDELKNRWIIVGLIWLGALLLTYWNSNKIDLIIRDRGTEEILQQDRKFWKHHSENIANILKKGASACQNVSSAKLGLLSVENQLRSLAGKHGLSSFKMESQPDQGNEFGIPVDLFFKGSFEGTMHWLNAFEKDYPYLSTRRLKITIDERARQAVILLSFYYRYKLSFPKDTG